MNEPQFPPLLLRNDKVHRNLCSLNSILQFLRHIPEFHTELTEWENTSPLLKELRQVLSKAGKKVLVSALELRKCLAQATDLPLNSGAQYDTVELFSHLLEHCPSQLFSFGTSHQYRFQIDNRASPCPTCNQFPSPIAGSDTILRLTLPTSASAIPLDDLLKRHFSIHAQSDGRCCTNCLSTQPNCPKLPYMERLNIVKYPEYMIIQILRMDFKGGKTVKNPTAIDISRPDNFLIDKHQYSIIGTISHMGTPDAGHNRAYLRKGSQWFLCEDSKLPVCQIPSDTPFEQSYCILLKRSNSSKQVELPMIKECSVVIEPLSEAQAQNTYAAAATASKQSPERLFSKDKSSHHTSEREAQGKS